MMDYIEALIKYIKHRPKVTPILTRNMVRYMAKKFNLEQKQAIKIVGICLTQIQRQKLIPMLRKDNDYRGVYFVTEPCLLGDRVYPYGVAAKAIFIPNKYAGYVGGATVVNALHLTTACAARLEIYTNLAKKDYYQGNLNVYIRKPVVKITKKNIMILKFLDVVKDMDLTTGYEWQDKYQMIADVAVRWHLDLKLVEEIIKKYDLRTNLQWQKIKLKLRPIQTLDNAGIVLKKIEEVTDHHDLHHR